ncbi:MAG: GNAT family N-acetyltransferase [Fibrobacteres bacterium]|jgi:ribosomal protein S18 acetylase RimI-like enzyme|nr:GNAT family N-acetyltransferase [Fibrobacterota bacterium]
MDIHIANLSDRRDATALVELLDGYARDPMGGGVALDPQVKQRLPRDLAARPTCMVLIARIDGQAAGVAVSFEGYSTFAGAPLLNLHDFAVAPTFRGRGVARALLERLFEEARRRGCCKVTLEVLSGNQRALSVYQRAGFAGYELDPATGHALFLQKKL